MPDRVATPEPVRELSLADKVAALRDPACHSGARVEAIETHMSWVFLTDTEAFKLKKPVYFDGVDFRSLDGRRFYCLEELRLNRRLAPSVYLDVMPLVLGTDGRIHVGGNGRTVDWLVRMRRLPSGLMLDKMLARRVATPAQMRAIAARLAEFHGAQPPVQLDGVGYRSLLLRHIMQSEAALCDPAWGLPAGHVAALCGRLRFLLIANASVLDHRATTGRIVEAHGDLRPEHVYLGEPMAIIDCLEFSRALRLLDGADEVGFLALECEMAHAAPLAQALVEAYREITGDPVPPRLLHFYQSVRACIRARLAIQHLRDPRYRASQVWRQRALRYLALAERHVAQALLHVHPDA